MPPVVCTRPRSKHQLDPLHDPALEVRSTVSSKFWGDILRVTSLRVTLSNCHASTSSSTRPARGAWPIARKRARTPRLPYCKADAEYE
jgi:hypothetical protein